MNLTAFIIDDDQICHFITRHLIKSENLAQEATCFYEAEEALQQMLSELPDSLPDMIFLDLNMPHMNGWQFLEALKPYESQISPHTKIFILTSSVDAVDQEKSWDFPLVSGYFLKPLQIRDLESIRELFQAENQ